MSKNLGRIAYTLALAGLKKGGSGSSSGGSGTSESPYDYAIKNSIFSGSKNQFNQAWKNSLNNDFKDQLFIYLKSVGYTDVDMINADKYIGQLVTGQLKFSDTFYDSMAKLGFTDDKLINTIMTKLFKGTLTMEEFYKNLQTLEYAEDFNTMQDKIYELFTKELADKDVLDKAVEDIGEIKDEIEDIKANCVNPYEYAHNIDNSITQDEFDKNYMAMAIGNTIYLYAQKLIPDIANSKVDEIMKDLLDEKFLKSEKTIYEHLVDEYSYTGTEDDAKLWILRLVDGMLKSPYMLAEELGETSEDTFNLAYKTYLVDHIFDGGGNDVYPGNWEPIPIEPTPTESFDIYEFYQSIGYNLTRQDLYNRLLTLANGILSGGSASDDITDLGGDKFEGSWNTPEESTFTQKSLYELYKEIADGDILNESDFVNRFNNYMQEMIHLDCGGEDKYEGEWNIKPDEPIAITPKTLYELYQDIGLNSENMSLEEFSKKALDYMENSELPYVTDGGNAYGDVDNKVFEGEFIIKDIPGCECTTKNLYELYLEIAKDNVVSEDSFNDRINALVQEIVNINGGGEDKYEGEYKANESGITIESKTLYELYKDIGMKDISEDEFENQLISLVNGELSNHITGGDSEGKNNKDEYIGEFKVKDGVDCNCLKDIDVQIISGGNAESAESDNLNDVFHGSFKGEATTDDFYSYMKSLGYTSSKKLMEEQLVTLLSGTLTGILDGGDSNNEDDVAPGQKFDGEFDTSKVATPEFVNYMRSLGYSGSAEELGQRMLNFSNGLIDGTLDGNR